MTPQPLSNGPGVGTEEGSAGHGCGAGSVGPVAQWRRAAGLLYVHRIRHVALQAIGVDPVQLGGVPAENHVLDPRRQLRVPELPSELLADLERREGVDLVLG